MKTPEQCACEMCSNVTKKTIKDVALKSLVLTLNRFYTLCWCFHWKGALGTWVKVYAKCKALDTCNFTKKQASPQVFSCEYGAIFQLWKASCSADIYLFKVNNSNTTKRYEIYSELTIKGAITTSLYPSKTSGNFLTFSRGIVTSFWCFYC